MTLQTTIPGRFNGPPLSGNGGYSCGLLAASIEGPARVRLHVPPPLETELRVVNLDGGRVELYDGETLVGSGAPAPEAYSVPAAPGLAAAREAMQRFPAYHNHPFGTCFVCGPDRPGRDGLELFTGPVDGWDLLACEWQPGEDLLDKNGGVRTEIVWAALDCPGYFAAVQGNLRPALLGELYAELIAPVPGNTSLVVYSWPDGAEGRKLYGGAAIANASGEVLAHSRSTWIVVEK